MRLGERRIGAAHLFWTDRHGGVSAGRYASLNLADHVGDSPSAVAENRRRACVAVADRFAGGASGTMSHDALEIVWLQQEHGSRVHVVAAPGRVRSDARPPVADAAVTALPGVALAVLSADCVPIAFACEGAVGVAHAGWKGMIRGVVEAAVAEMRTIGAGRVNALVGPCIHAERYEFGPPDLRRIADQLGPGVIARTGRGTPALDLPAAARVVLERAGVAAGDIEIVGECTAASADYFSHRRDGETGRQAMIAVLGR